MQPTSTDTAPPDPEGPDAARDIPGPDVVANAVHGTTAATIRSPGDWARTGTRARTTRVFPFVVLCLCAVAVATVVPGGTDRISLLLTATALMVLTGLIMVWTPWHRIHLEWRHLPVVTFCAGVVLLREATGGSETGYGTVLVLLPVVWQAIYGRRRDLGVALVLAASALLVPLVVFEDYPVRIELPRITLMLMVGTATGTLLQSMVSTVRANDETLRQLVWVSRDLHTGADPRLTLCEAVRTVVHADRVVLAEPQDGTLRVTARAGFEPDATGALPPDPDPGGALSALTSGELQVVDLHGLTTDPRRGSEVGGRLHLPVGPPDRARGVVTAVWDDARPHLRRGMLGGLSLLGADAAFALERVDLIAQLDQQAHIDGTTGLANRRAWDELLQREIAVAERTGRPLSIAIIDLDHFKAFNDRHGHLAGDELLHEAAEAWSSCLRTGDVLARWGGEEFAVLFPGSDIAAAEAATERLRPRTPGGQTFSAGVSQFEPGDSAGQLVASADAAMYQAKAAGRARTMRAVRFPGPEPDGGQVSLAS